MCSCNAWDHLTDNNGSNGKWKLSINYLLKKIIEQLLFWLYKRIEIKRNSFIQNLWTNWWGKFTFCAFLKKISLCIDTQCNLTPHENMRAALQRTPLCAMKFATGPPQWEEPGKALDVVLWDVLPCSSDEQAAFIWECTENHLDERGDSSAHQQTKPKHTARCLSQSWASKWNLLFWVRVDFCSFIVETKEELNKNMYTDNTQRRH